MCAVNAIIFSALYTVLDYSNEFNSQKKIYGDLLAITAAVGYSVTSNLIEKLS